MEIIHTPAASYNSPAESTESENEYSVMVLDDDISICLLIQEILEGEGYRVVTATEASEGLKLLKFV